MILDPDEPRPTALTARQALICTEHGWTVLGQPDTAAERQFARMRMELGELCPARSTRDVARAASVLTAALSQEGLLNG